MYRLGSFRLGRSLDHSLTHGGGALIKGLDKRLNAKTGIPFHVAEDPLRAIARGTGIALKNINRFSFLMK